MLCFRKINLVMMCREDWRGKGTKAGRAARRQVRNPKPKVIVVTLEMMREKQCWVVLVSKCRTQRAERGERVVEDSEAYFLRIWPLGPCKKGPCFRGSQSDPTLAMSFPIGEKFVRARGHGPSPFLDYARYLRTRIHGPNSPALVLSLH